MYIEKLKNFLISPFKHHFVSFICSFIVASLCDFIIRLYVYNSIQFGILFSCIIFTMVYILFLPLQFLPIGWHKVYKSLIFLIAICNAIVDLICLTIMHGGAFNEFIGVIAGTNLGEIVEFYKAYFSWNIFMYLFIFAIFILVISLILKKIESYKINFGRISLCIVLVSMSLLFLSNRFYYIQDCFLGKIYQLVNFESAPDLLEFYSNPQLKYNHNDKPKNIIIVIGESFSKEHSSLYGYNKETNPLLQKFRDSTLLYVFDNVKCAEIKTIPNIKRIMSTFTTEEKLKEWYECITLPEILRIVGYKTFWISNQSEKGLWDNVTTKYAELCDSVMFVGGTYSGLDKVSYDENVLSPLNKCLYENKNNYNVFFIHLMGSHPEFSSRYPQDKEFFLPEDYLNAHEHQRTTLSHYDNSILYNDEVVYNIFHYFEDYECIGFYFSDHSLDIYNTDDYFAGHARSNVPESVSVATQVPFLVFVSNIYKKNFINNIYLIEKNIHNHYNTENFIYTVMDVIGVDFIDEEVNDKTLFSR